MLLEHSRGLEMHQVVFEHYLHATKDLPNNSCLYEEPKYREMEQKFQLLASKRRTERFQTFSWKIPRSAEAILAESTKETGVNQAST